MSEKKEWVEIEISLTALVPVEALGSVAPGINVEEFVEALKEDDPDEAIDMLLEYLIVGEAMQYVTDFDIEDVDIQKEG